jgi:triple functional domain protein
LYYNHDFFDFCVRTVLRIKCVALPATRISTTKEFSLTKHKVNQFRRRSVKFQTRYPQTHPDQLKMDKDKCLQLKMYENDVQKMLDWIKSNRDLFMMHYVKLGRNSQEAHDLQEQHSFFCAGSMNVYVNISRLQQAAASLIENNHFATNSVQQMSEKLDKCWSDFASSLDLRAALLKTAVAYYAQCDTFVSNSQQWKGACELPTTTNALPNNVNELEELVHEHQKLCDLFTSSHSELLNSSKKLLIQLEQFISFCYQRKFAGNSSSAVNNGSTTSSSSSSSICSVTGAQSSQQRNSYVDYTDASKPIVQASAEVLAVHRSLDCLWQAKKLKLHQRLALALFQEDVRQVIEWVDTHGEGFLRKHIGVGRSLARATQLQESHAHFEAVAGNTYTNAEKLLIAAEEFAQTGECNPDEIYAVAQRLERNISGFAKRVERRRYTLQLAVLFYKHATDLFDWFDQNGASWEADGTTSNQPFKAPATLLLCEQQLKQLMSERACMLDAAQDTLTEGQTLLEELNKQRASCQGDEPSMAPIPLDPSVESSVQAIQNTVEKVQTMQKQLKDLLTARKARIELSLQLRLIEKDSYQLCKQFELCRQELARLQAQASNDLSCAEQMLQMHGETTTRIQRTAFDVVQRGQELARLLQTYDFTITAGSAIDFGVTETADGKKEESIERDASELIARILTALQQRENEFEEVCELSRGHLDQAVQLCQIEIDAKQVISWMRNGESMLAASFMIPTCLQEAEDLQAEHEQVQLAFEKTHASAYQLHQRADLIIQNFPRSGDSVRNIVEQVSRRWQLLMTHAEDRHKLVIYACGFFKTVQQVLLVLDSLAKQYATEEDFCGASSIGAAETDNETISPAVNEKKIAQVISKHQEQKEAFLKACTLARRNAETFIKYASRCSVYSSGGNGDSAHAGTVYRGAETRVKHILEHILQQENRALECWARRKRRLDQCQQYVLVEHSARQALRWICETGDSWLEQKQQKVSELDETSDVLQQIYECLQAFSIQVRETKEKVRLLVQLSENLIDRKHVHSDAIRFWCSKVEQRFVEFSKKFERFEMRLQRTLGITSNDLRSPNGSESASVSSSQKLVSRLGSEDEDQEEQLLRVASLSLVDRSPVDCSRPVTSTDQSEELEINRKLARKRAFIMNELLQTERTYVADLCICIQSYLVQYDQNEKCGQLPASITGKSFVIFGNIKQIYSFHKE